jgi:flagellar biogenesis protein FliO
MKSLFLAFTLLLGANAFGAEKVKLESIDFNRNANQGTIVLKLDQSLPETPELTVKSSMIQIAIPGSYVWPKIEKKVSTGGTEFDTTILAYQYNKNLVRFRIMVPYELKGKENQVSLSLNDDEVVLNFPIQSVGMITTPANNIVKKKTPAKPAVKEIGEYDEGYLKSLLAEKKNVKLKDDFFKSKYKKKSSSIVKDEISVKASATKKKDNFLNTKKKSDFSVSSYVGKFVAFLGLIILFFYGVMHAMKKGVLKKGKLGFLNDTNIVEVLNTTYLGPKKSLLLVKVHKQVFLLSSTDKGLEFLSELNDTTGLLKEGEESVTGSNFDSTLKVADSNDKTFKIKELTKGLTKVKEKKASAKKKSDNSKKSDNNEAGLEEFLSKAEGQVSDRVKLSDQIKSKVKNLKQFQ